MLGIVGGLPVVKFGIEKVFTKGVHQMQGSLIGGIRLWDEPCIGGSPLNWDIGTLRIMNTVIEMNNAVSGSSTMPFAWKRFGILATKVEGATRNTQGEALEAVLSRWGEARWGRRNAQDPVLA